jgi:hypothetical protein
VLDAQQVNAAGTVLELPGDQCGTDAQASNVAGV